MRKFVDAKGADEKDQISILQKLLCFFNYLNYYMNSSQLFA